MMSAQFQEEIQKRAYFIWKGKWRRDIPSTPDQNWFEAIEQYERNVNLEKRDYHEVY